MNEKYKPHEISHEKYLKNVDDFLKNTIKLLKNEKVCPKSSRWLGADEIKTIAQRIHTEVHYANSIEVKTAREKMDRSAAQTRAIALMKTLGEKFEFDSGLWDMDVNKLEGWLIEKGKIQAWITSWRKNEERRYKDIG